MWQPIDTIPNGDYNAEIDIWDGYERITDCYWNNGGWYYPKYESGFGWHQVRVDYIKFWMYVPKPPTE